MTDPVREVALTHEAGLIDAGRLAIQEGAALPELAGPHYLVRLSPAGDGVPRDEVQVGLLRITPEWRAVDQHAFEFEEQKVRKFLREEPGSIEIDFRDPEALDSVEARAKRLGGESEKAYKAARSAARKAEKALADQLAAIDAATQELRDASAGLDRAELDFGAGKAEWSAVETAQGKRQQAAARLRFAERGLGQLEERMAAAGHDRLRAEYRVAAELLDEDRISAELDKALAPAVQAWPKVAEALEAAGVVLRRFADDDAEARALASQLERMGRSGELEGLAGPRYRQLTPQQVVSRFTKLANTAAPLPVSLVQHAFDHGANRS